MRETTTQRGRKRILTKSELLSPNASSILGQVLAELPPVPADTLSELPAQFKGKRTHKATEPKAKPRSYRFSVSVERKMAKAQRKLRVQNQTTFVEGAIIAACRQLGI